MRQNSCKTGQSSVFSLLQKTGSDGDERTVSGKLFQLHTPTANSTFYHTFVVVVFGVHRYKCVAPQVANDLHSKSVLVLHIQRALRPARLD